MQCMRYKEFCSRLKSAETSTDLIDVVKSMISNLLEEEEPGVYFLITVRFILIGAAIFGDIECVKLLLPYLILDPDDRLREIHPFPLLRTAGKFGHVPLAEFLLTLPDWKLLESEVLTTEESSLITACENGDYEMVVILLKAFSGEMINRKNASQHTCLSVAYM